MFEKVRRSVGSRVEEEEVGIKAREVGTEGGVGRVRRCCETSDTFTSAKHKKAMERDLDSPFDWINRKLPLFSLNQQ